MATCYLTLSLLLLNLMTLIISSRQAVPLKNQDLVVATEEMARANYFAFVMIINIFALDQRIQGNITFLMPNDRMLSKTIISQDSLSDFLLRHSIPSPLLIDYLEHIPSGSILPSSEPGYMLHISNKGRRNFFLNNVKIISPNICTSGTSIRCHGIDGVLNDVEKPPSTTCPNTPIAPPPVGLVTPPAPSLEPAPTLPVDIPVAVPPDHNEVPEKSGSSLPACVPHRMLLKMLVNVVLVLVSVLF